MSDSPSFFTNHARVLMCIAEGVNGDGLSQVRLREIADDASITERAAQRIVSSLADKGFITRSRSEKSKRSNVYALTDESRLLVKSIRNGMTHSGEAA